MGTTSTIFETTTPMNEDVLAAQAVAPLALKQLEVGKAYRLNTTVRSQMGYQLNPGVHIVTQAEHSYNGLHTFNTETERKEVFYPVEFLPFVPVEGTTVITDYQRRNPSAFAGFGADSLQGTDPEVFVVNAADEVIPAYKFLTAKSTSEKEGLKAWSQYEKAYRRPYWDGFQAEYTVKPWACIAQLTDCIHAGLAHLHKAAVAHDPTAHLTATPVLPVPAAELASADEKYVELGCMPSLNVYGHSGANPGNGRDLPIRFAGFHMHMTLPKDDKNEERISTIVRLIDKLCGVTSVAALQGLEDPIRRRYYGLAGEHRLPTHGLEWRVLSSAVLWHPAIVHLHFNLARAARQLAQNGLSNLWDGSDEEAVDIINTLDVDGAKRLLTRNRELMLGVLYDSYPNPHALGRSKITPPRYAFALDNIIMPGFKESIDLDMTKNWYLTSPWKIHCENADCCFNNFLSSRVKAAQKAGLVQ